MAACKFCGKWAGIGSTQHDYCAKAAAERRINGGSALPADELSAAAPPPLEFKHIVWGVFCGMWLFGISAAIIYSIFLAITHS